MPRGLWESQVPGAMSSVFRRAKIRSEIARMNEAGARLAMLQDDWQHLVYSKLWQVFQSAKIRATIPGFLTTEHNILKRIANEISTVYKWGATRTLITDAATETARALWEEMRIDEVLAYTQLVTNVVRDHIIAPRVVDGTMRVVHFLGDRTTVVQDTNDPSVAVAMRSQETLSQTPGFTQIRSIYADAEVWRTWDENGNMLSEEEHGLGRFPAVVIHAGERVGCFWGDSEFRDVAEANVAIAINLFRLNRLTHFQSELQPTYRGNARDVAKGKTIGGDNLWAGPGDWGVLNLQGDPSKLISVIQSQIGWIANQHGIAADVYNLSAGATSGFQIRLKRAPIESVRAAQLKLWRRVERELLLLMAMVSERDHPLHRLDPMDAEFKLLDFHEEPMLEDPKTQNDVWAERLKLGVTSEARIAQELNPDLTLEQAKKHVLDLVAEREPVIAMKKRLGDQETTQEATGREGGFAKARNGTDE